MLAASSVPSAGSRRDMANFPDIPTTERDADSPITQELLTKYFSRDQALRERLVGDIVPDPTGVGHDAQTLFGQAFDTGAGTWAESVDASETRSGNPIYLYVPVYASRLHITSWVLWNSSSGTDLEYKARWVWNGAALVTGSEVDVMALGAKFTDLRTAWTIDVPAADRETIVEIYPEMIAHASVGGPLNAKTTCGASGFPSSTAKDFVIAWLQT